jgi:hypothetical protein
MIPPLGHRQQIQTPRHRLLLLLQQRRPVLLPMQKQDLQAPQVVQLQQQLVPAWLDQCPSTKAHRQQQEQPQQQ